MFPILSVLFYIFAILICIFFLTVNIIINQNKNKQQLFYFYEKIISSICTRLFIDNILRTTRHQRPHYHVRNTLRQTPCKLRIGSKHRHCLDTTLQQLHFSRRTVHLRQGADRAGVPQFDNIPGTQKYRYIGRGKLSLSQGFYAFTRHTFVVLQPFVAACPYSVRQLYAVG